MVIREEKEGFIYMIPLKDFEKIFFKDLQNLKEFAKLCKTHAKINKKLEISLNNLIYSIDNIKKEEFYFIKLNKDDLIFIKEIMEGMNSESINIIFGKMYEDTIKNGVIYLKSIIEG